MGDSATRWQVSGGQGSGNVREWVGEKASRAKASPSGKGVPGGYFCAALASASGTSGDLVVPLVGSSAAPVGTKGWPGGGHVHDGNYRQEWNAMSTDRTTISSGGVAVLRDPIRNRGTAFTAQQRSAWIHRRIGFDGAS
jgi:hypothetical protein